MKLLLLLCFTSSFIAEAKVFSISKQDQNKVLKEAVQLYNRNRQSPESMVEGVFALHNKQQKKKILEYYKSRKIRSFPEVTILGKYAYLTDKGKTYRFGIKSFNDFIVTVGNRSLTLKVGESFFERQRKLQSALKVSGFSLFSVAYADEKISGGTGFLTSVEDILIQLSGQSPKPGEQAYYENELKNMSFYDLHNSIESYFCPLKTQGTTKVFDQYDSEFVEKLQLRTDPNDPAFNESFDRSKSRGWQRCVFQLRRILTYEAVKKLYEEKAEATKEEIDDKKSNNTRQITDLKEKIRDLKNKIGPVSDEYSRLLAEERSKRTAYANCSTKISGNVAGACDRLLRQLNRASDERREFEESSEFERSRERLEEVARLEQSLDDLEKESQRLYLEGELAGYDRDRDKKGFQTVFSECFDLLKSESTSKAESFSKANSDEEASVCSIDPEKFKSTYKKGSR